MREEQFINKLEQDIVLTTVYLAAEKAIEARHRSQTAEARLLDIHQPNISAWVNDRWEGLSVERLMHFLNAPDRDVGRGVSFARRAISRGTTVANDGGGAHP
jgi:predicted XRE-type DNA-binding protein